MDLRNTNEKKNSDPRNTHEKKFQIHEYPGEDFGSTKYPREKFQSQKIPTRKNFGPTTYPFEKKLDPRNTYEGTVARWHLNHETTNSTRSTEFSTFLLYDFPISFCVALFFFPFHYFYLSFSLSIPLTFSPSPHLSYSVLPSMSFEMEFSW